jgi:hypothetical protein
VIITGGFLAERAEIVDQKLNVVGGVLDCCTVPKVGHVDSNGNQLFAFAYFVTLMQSGPDDCDQSHQMTLEMIDGCGVRQFVSNIDVTVGVESGANWFWVAPIALMAEESGRLVLMATIPGGGSTSVPIELRVADPR